MVLDNDTKNQVKEMLSEMESEVKMLFFNKPGTQYGNEISELLDDLSSVSDKIKVIKLDETSEEVKKYNIDKFPAIVLEGKNKGMIRFFGIPSGYEFATLLEDLIMVSTGKVEISNEIIEYVKTIEKPLHLMVFITPTCPYCPRAVRFAHQIAMFNEKIVADMIEAIEFPELSNKFNVSGVPHTVINEKHEFVGAYPPEMAIEEIKKAL